MRLLVDTTEDFEVCVEETTLTEGTRVGKDYFITGPFLQAEVKNHNGRVYPLKILARECAKYSSEKILDNRGVGELGHPDNPSINFDRVSHKIVDLRQEGNNFIGRAKILNTPFGKIVKSLMDDDIKFGASSRALGSLVERKGYFEVQDDFHLITPADIVSDPSAPEAFVTAIMENKEWAWCNGKLVEKECKVKSHVNQQSVKGLNEDRLLKIFNYILNEI
jgi:hypothetical protein